MNHFHIGQDPEEVAALVAGFVQSEIARFSRYTWALSGGSTPRSLFALLAESYSGVIDWDRVEFYWGDERCVPPDSEESNYYWANRLFFDPMGIDPEQIHRIRGEEEFLQSEAQRYSDLIEHISRYRGGLNLAMLGMGEDGHTLSIFPGQDAIWESDNYAEISRHPGTGQKRITLTGKAISSARNIAILVTGSAKAELVNEVIHRRVGSDLYPVSWVTRMPQPIHWFIDREAARYLKVK